MIEAMTDARPAFDVRLAFTTTAAGGRRRPLLGGNSIETRMHYPTELGASRLAGVDQTAGPGTGLQPVQYQSGRHGEAVLIPLLTDHAPAMAATSCRPCCEVSP